MHSFPTPSRSVLRSSMYALAELGIATRSDEALWHDAKEYALEQHPSAPRRVTTRKPIWTTSEVRTATEEYRARGGRYEVPSQLLPALIRKLPGTGILGTSKKTKLSESLGVDTRIVYLSPAWESGMVMCPHHGACGRYCIGHSSGRMRMDPQRMNRLVKTCLWVLYPDWFLLKAGSEIMDLQALAAGEGLIPAVRMNGSSDVRWERFGLPQRYPGVRFYDYTKIPLKHRGKNGTLPGNYTLTFSLDEGPDSWSCALRYLRARKNVALVVAADWKPGAPSAKKAKADLLATGRLAGFPMVDGDEHDARFLDPDGAWVVLSAKDRAASDTEGFTYLVSKSGRLHLPSSARLPRANRRAA